MLTYIPDVSNQDGEHEDSHEPGPSHEENFGYVGRFLVLANRGRRLQAIGGCSEL